ncbi:MAG: cytochrome b/b6 domain-containing protein [Afipia sp.]|nr:cytochrome b/b6 domain-containing protein [Afipia sp.]
MSRTLDAETQAPADRTPQVSVYVWELPLRIFHWSLAVCIIVAWLSANVFETLHRVAGYTSIALVAFRIVWGFAGSRYARFYRTLPLLRIAPRYLVKFGRGRAGAYIGLNPAGAAMLVASLALVLISAISGWMQITIRFFGVDWVEELHTWSSYSLLVLAAIHVVGVAIASILQRQNLPAAMITGRKRRRFYRFPKR